MTIFVIHNQCVFFNIKKFMITSITDRTIKLFVTIIHLIPHVIITIHNFLKHKIEIELL